jgi:glycosyltransferase involved in cell wall biosynthesis
MSRYLVSVTIPTRNSGASLSQCLEAVRHQTFKNIEIIIIDAGSSDSTLDICRRYKCRVIQQKYGSLLWARKLGVDAAKGDFVLLLDSDQILDSTTISRCVDECKKGFDMVALEERSYKQETFLEILFALDRQVIEKVKNLDPYTGVILARFFKTSILKKAFSKIPKSLLLKLGGPDHAVIYFEVWNLSKKISEISHAVSHMEPDFLLPLLKKFYRWGSTSIDANYGKYKIMWQSKERFRTGLFTKGLIIQSFASILLLVIKGVPYKFGFYIEKLKRYLANSHT